jgi:predicted Zn-ribbon and HTH transcriptional regulator
MKAGRGCPECKKKALSDKFTGGKGAIGITKQEFVDRLKTVRDDVELIGEYTKSSEKTLFRCKVCSHEWPVRPHHIMQNSRCPNCNKRVYDDDLVDSKLVGDFANIQRISNISEPGQKVDFYCSDCENEFNMYPPTLFNTKQETKCPVCRQLEGNLSGFDCSKVGTLYIACVVVNDTILYKVGITNRDAKIRLKECFKKFALHKTFTSSGKQIMKLEKVIKRLMKPYRAFSKHDQADCKSGKSEIYTENPMLIVPKLELIKAFQETS